MHCFVCSWLWLGPGYATEQNRYGPTLIEPMEKWKDSLYPNHPNAYYKGEKRVLGENHGVGEWIIWGWRVKITSLTDT